MTKKAGESYKTNPNIEIIDDEKSIIFKTSCACHSNDHDMTVWIEWDKEFSNTTLSMYTKMGWSDYWVPTPTYEDRSWFVKTLDKLYFIFNKKYIYKSEEKKTSPWGALEYKIGRAYRRITCAWKMLRKGEIEFESNTIFRNKQHAESFLLAALESIQKVEERNSKNEEKTT